MTIVELQREDFDRLENKGSLYHRRFILAPTQESGAIRMPVQSIEDIAISTEQDVTIQLTNAPIRLIVEDQAIWFEYDGTSRINKAITGINIINGATPAIVDVTIRTKSW